MYNKKSNLKLVPRLRYRSPETNRIVDNFNKGIEGIVVDLGIQKDDIANFSSRIEHHKGGHTGVATCMSQSGAALLVQNTPHVPKTRPDSGRPSF